MGVRPGWWPFDGKQLGPIDAEVFVTQRRHVYLDPADVLPIFAPRPNLKERKARNNVRCRLLR